MAGQGERYEALDGLRGVAALAVVLYHASPAGHSLLPGGYLAVDLFFMLSGFVIDRAYATRLAAGMGLGEFLARRAARLYPAYLLGLAVPFLALLAGVAPGNPAAQIANLPLYLTNFVMLPSLPFGHDDAFPLFPLDGAYWSLLGELVANLLYAALLFRASRTVLALAATVLAAKLALALGHAGSANVGAEWSGLGFGLLRAATGFLIGVVLARFAGRQRRSALGDCLLPALALLAMAGRAGTPGRDGLAIFVLFPALVWAGAHWRPRLPHLHDVLGRLSYPLYCLHIPLLVLAGTAMSALALPQPAGMALALPMIVVTALLVDRWWDAPLRAMLARAVGRRCAVRLERRPGADQPPAGQLLRAG